MTGFRTPFLAEWASETLIEAALAGFPGEEGGSVGIFLIFAEDFC
jgi:hypothetical protein